MFLEDMQHIIPKDWSPMNLLHEKYKIVALPPHSFEFIDVEHRILGNYNCGIQSIFKLQNPYLYTKFQLKAYEYEQRGPYEVKTLFHDTSRENDESIACFNFDWRYGERFMFGPGVYFSVSPYYAHKHSSRNNGALRTMFVAQVLVQRVQIANGDIFLPDFGYDTVLCHGGVTYVKYFDCEYYPQYLVHYVS